MPQVQVPPPYQGPTLGNGRIEVEGASVLACLEAVGAKYPGFLEQVLDSQGAVHRFVQLFAEVGNAVFTALAPQYPVEDPGSLSADLVLEVGRIRLVDSPGELGGGATRARPKDQELGE